MLETQPGERPDELEGEPGGGDEGEGDGVTPAEEQQGGAETDQPDPDTEGPDPDSENPAT
jgi:hypothetical protein